MRIPALALASACALAAPARSDPAAIIDARAEPGASGWTITVTLRHDDTGWDDYADGWRILDDEGRVLATRILAHPHVEEQPFTRSLANVAIPDGIGMVSIEASTSVEAWGGEAYPLALPAD